MTEVKDLEETIDQVLDLKKEMTEVKDLEETIDQVLDLKKSLLAKKVPLKKVDLKTNFPL